LQKLIGRGFFLCLCFYRINVDYKGIPPFIRYRAKIPPFVQWAAFLRNVIAFIILFFALIPGCFAVS